MRHPGSHGPRAVDHEYNERLAQIVREVVECSDHLALDSRRDREVLIRTLCEALTNG